MATALATAVLERAPHIPPDRVPPPLPEQEVNRALEIYQTAMTTAATNAHQVQFLIGNGPVWTANRTGTNLMLVNEYTNQPLIITTPTTGPAITYNNTYIQTTGASIINGIVGNRWHILPGMITQTAWNNHELTALEFELLSHYPALLEIITARLTEGKMLTGDYLAFIAEEEILTMPDRELFPYAIRAMRRSEFAFNNLTSGAHSAIRKKLQEDLHHPAPWAVVAGGSVGFRSREIEWGDLEIAEEHEVGEDLIRTMLNRQYFPLVVRWRRDLGVFQRARVWARTPDGQAWIQEDAEQRRREELAMQLRVEGYQNQTRLYEAAASAWEKKLVKTRKAREGVIKASIKKATKLFERMDQTSKLRMFISNEEVTIDSEESKVKFIVRSTGGPGWLFDRTQHGRSHTPYELMVLTKDDVFLMKLCVYFKDTPVLDQLLAISVLVDAGDEERLLTKGNWFGHHGNWTEEKTDYIVENYPALATRCPVVTPKLHTVLERPTADTTGVLRGDGTAIFTNYVDESRQRWEPFEGRVTQWIKTWFETTIAPQRELALH